MQNIQFLWTRKLFQTIAATVEKDDWIIPPPRFVTTIALVAVDLDLRRTTAQTLPRTVQLLSPTIAENVHMSYCIRMRV
jgi:hypothetical protein